MKIAKSTESLLEMALAQLAEAQSGRLHAPASVAVGAMYCAMLSVLDAPLRDKFADHPSVEAARQASQRLGLISELRDPALQLIERYYAPQASDAATALALAQEVVAAVRAYRLMAAG